MLWLCGSLSLTETPVRLKRSVKKSLEPAVGTHKAPGTAVLDLAQILSPLAPTGFRFAKSQI